MAAAYHARLAMQLLAAVALLGLPQEGAAIRLELAELESPQMVINTCGGNANGAPCTFPFTYRGLEYTACTSVERATEEPWCFTDQSKVTGRIPGEKWGNCICSADDASRPFQEDSNTTDNATQDSCANLVSGGERRKSAWRRWRDKCKCTDETQVVACDAPNECPELGRYYSDGGHRHRSQGCRCQQNTCSDECQDIIEGAVSRNTAWFREQKCKCEKGKRITGSNADCRSLEPIRHFAIRDYRGKDCMCAENDTTTTFTTTTVTTTPEVAARPGAATRLSSLSVVSLAWVGISTML